MAKPLPTYLYKYTTAMTAEKVLENRSLRWSVPIAFNDPYDVQFDLHLEVDIDKVRRMSLDKMWSAFRGSDQYTPEPGNLMGALIAMLRTRAPKISRKEFEGLIGGGIEDGIRKLGSNLPEKHAFIREVMMKSQILCCSEVCDSLLMWAYYGEQHKGVVLAFKPIRELDTFFLAARPVVYSHRMPRLFDEEYLSNMFAGLARARVDAIVDALVYTKALEWQHEREWRMCAAYGDSPGALYDDVKFDHRELDSIVFGCLMPKETRTKLTQLVQSLYPHARLLQVTKDDRNYKLVIRDA